MEHGPPKVPKKSAAVRQYLQQRTSFHLYKALNPNTYELRLLEVLPGQIGCRIHHVSLLDDPPPQYETISYVWGDASNRAILKVNDLVMDVPASSAEAIHRVRYRHESRMVWIDAICINQLDLQERSQQVQMMSVIYPCGWRNIVWLGYSQASAASSGRLGPLAARVIDVVYMQLKDEFGSIEKAHETLRDSSRRAELRARPPEADVSPSFGVLTDLFQRPWFTRKWVVQEAVLPRRSVCYLDATQFDLDKVFIIGSWLWNMSNHFPHVPFDRDTLFHVDNVWRLAGTNHSTTSTTGGTLLSLLHGLSFCQAQDPRDAVYGVLGLLQAFRNLTGLPNLLQPDYSKPVSHVYRDAARFIADDTGSLEVVTEQRARRSASPPSWSPTWAPQWMHIPSVARQPMTFYSPRYLAHAGRRYVPATIRSPDELVVRGVIVGRLCYLTSEVSTEVLECPEKRRSLVQMIYNKWRPSPGFQQDVLSAPQGDLSVLASTLVADMAFHDDIRYTASPIKEFTSLFGPHNDIMRIPTALEALSGDLTMRYLCAVTAACRYRRLFVTDAGHIGVGSSQMQAEDIVAIVYGAHMPLLLRPRERAFELIDACYVHGIMDGEAVRRHDDEAKADEVFVLN